MSFAAAPEPQAIRLLRHDLVGASLPAAELTRLARIAMADGDMVGAALRADHPRCFPADIAAALGVRVIETETDPWAGPFLRHADYLATPPEIRLFRRSIDALELETGLDLGQVFLAHELYHHVEATRRMPSLPRRHAVSRLRVGPWRLGAPILALSEIAAASCARTLLALPYDPASLDLRVLARHGVGAGMTSGT